MAAENERTLDLDYDPWGDVLRAYCVHGQIRGTAIQLRDFLLVVDEQSGEVLEVCIENLRGFMRRYGPPELTAYEGEELFAHARPEIERLLPLIARNAGSLARERIAKWDAWVDSQVS